MVSWWSAGVRFYLLHHPTTQLLHHLFIRGSTSLVTLAWLRPRVAGLRGVLIGQMTHVGPPARVRVTSNYARRVTQPGALFA